MQVETQVESAWCQHFCSTAFKFLASYSFVRGARHFEVSATWVTAGFSEGPKSYDARDLENDEKL